MTQPKKQIVIDTGDERCAAWDGQQCKVRKKLTACAMTIQQGTILKGPHKVIVKLCPKHFQLDMSRRWRGTER